MLKAFKLFFYYLTGFWIVHRVFSYIFNTVKRVVKKPENPAKSYYSAQEILDKYGLTWEEAQHIAKHHKAASLLLGALATALSVYGVWWAVNMSNSLEIMAVITTLLLATTTIILAAREAWKAAIFGGQDYHSFWTWFKWQFLAGPAPRDEAHEKVIRLFE